MTTCPINVGNDDTITLATLTVSPFDGGGSAGGGGGGG